MKNILDIEMCFRFYAPFLSEPRVPLDISKIKSILVKISFHYFSVMVGFGLWLLLSSFFFIHLIQFILNRSFFVYIVFWSSKTLRRRKKVNKNKGRNNILRAEGHQKKKPRGFPHNLSEKIINGRIVTSQGNVQHQGLEKQKFQVGLGSKLYISFF